ncbi:hypothetical protein ABB34_04855 [Stenotrophomonas daejeonensis]|uniref:Lipoprotein n=1 Tax=Stenotrophomonas daejeonensis TaxID=659018 RepID=A0A0R0EAQ9_9GAMM|nr:MULTISPECIES: hypothetical protein [Stenotrophomonas]KRG87450.1 hypothetical protein ABB34_04855 [Stenotrophomonas daejeonensis]MCG8276407.1 hypothetical protein [Stenotrophomonas sp. NLF4-10]
MRKYLLVAALCLLSACGHGIDGTYTDAMGVAKYTFTSGGKVTIEAMGISQETSYVREGDTLKVALPQKGASLDFTVGEDGALTGPLGIRLEKVGK